MSENSDIATLIYYNNVSKGQPNNNNNNNNNILYNNNLSVDKPIIKTNKDSRDKFFLEQEKKFRKK